MEKLKNLIISFELRNPVAAVIFLAIYALSGRFANGSKRPLGTMKLAALGVPLLLLPALLVSGPGVAYGQAVRCRMLSGSTNSAAHAQSY